ncbi:MAG: trpA [Rickettsiaceae bacterium]|jgi:tryptophan synthase alpha chain|nr:trpA [Rickettsiaceae bacterium]
MNRLKTKFDTVKQQNRSALITYIMAYDPNLTKSSKILNGLPEAGADIIELGMPFSDPMADGPTIQEAAIRALDAGAKLSKILEMVAKFRKNNDHTPIVLMGYYNPLQNYGLKKFVSDAKKSGVDAFLIVDLPPEEDLELYACTESEGISLIKLVTPTTDDKRLKIITEKASGFIYYVAVAGVTGTKSATYDSIGAAVERIRRHTYLPIAVGFGIKTPKDVKQVAKHSDAVVVGSSLVSKIADGDVDVALDFVRDLAKGTL